MSKQLVMVERSEKVPPILLLEEPQVILQSNSVVLCWNKIILRGF